MKFKNERTQPAIDLAGRLALAAPKKILDIGCGPGNSSQVLARAFPQAHVLGIDSSADMIESAKGNYPGIDFMLCDAGAELSRLDRDFDIVFSNACIQWIPSHRELLRNMLARVSPGGVIAIQTPMTHKAPIHQIIRELSAEERWKPDLAGVRAFHNLTQEEYFDLLSEIAAEFSMWETVYFHVLQSLEDIIEWYRGTGLRPYLDALSEEKKKQFEAAILERLARQYRAQKNGEIIFRFARLFFIARSANRQ